MIDIHVSGKNAKELLDELRELLNGTASAPAHVSLSVTEEEPPAEDEDVKPSCTLEDLRGVLNAVRVKHGIDVVRGLLKEAGTDSLTTLKESKYDAVLGKAADLLKEDE